MKLKKMDYTREQSILFGFLFLVLGFLQLMGSPRVENPMPYLVSGSLFSFSGLSMIFGALYFNITQRIFIQKATAIWLYTYATQYFYVEPDPSWGGFVVFLILCLMILAKIRSMEKAEEEKKMAEFITAARIIKDKEDQE